MTILNHIVTEHGFILVEYQGQYLFTHKSYADFSGIPLDVINKRTHELEDHTVWICIDGKTESSTLISQRTLNRWMLVDNPSIIIRILELINMNRYVMGILNVNQNQPEEPKDAIATFERYLLANGDDQESMQHILLIVKKQEERIKKLEEFTHYHHTLVE